MQHDRRAFLKQFLGAAGAGLIVELLTACTPAPTGTSQPAAPAAAKALSTVRCGFASFNPSNLVPIVGREKPDLPATFRIGFDLVATTNSPSALTALVGGSLDVAVVTPDAAWAAQDKAPDVKQLIAVGNGTPYVLIAQPEIQKATDLRGMTVGASAVRAGADTTAMRLLLFENGLKDGDYTIVQAGDVAERTAAMKAHAIAGVVQLEPQATLLRDAGFKQVDNANNYPALKDVHFIVLVARQGWYAGKAEVAANLVRAWDAITKWVYDPANKGEVVEIIKRTMGGTDLGADSTYAIHIGQDVVTRDLQIKSDFLRQFIDNQRKLGAAAENLPSDPMKYVDATVLEASRRA